MMEYDYVPLPQRGALHWPGGKTVALILTFNLETWDLVKDTDRPYYAGGPPILPDVLPGNTPDYPSGSASGACSSCLIRWASARAAPPMP
jgi:hypothetical protein